MLLLLKMKVLLLGSHVLDLRLVQYKRLHRLLLGVGKVDAVDPPVQLQLLELELLVTGFKMGLHADGALHRQTARSALK